MEVYPEHISLRQFDRLSSAEQQAMAFKACGCLIAFPSWWQGKPTGHKVNCLHLECRIARGEFPIPWLARFNAQFRSEMSNWLRFQVNGDTEQRRSVARLYWAMKRKREFNMMAAVFVGVMGPQA